MTISRQPTAGVVVALALAYLAAIAPAGAFDGRSPDTKGSAKGGVAVSTTTKIADGRSIDTRLPAGSRLDLRSPDTVDAVGRAGTAAVAPADVRSPDTRQAAATGGVPFTAPTPAASFGNGGFAWTEALVGGAAGFAIALLLAGVFTALRGRSHHRMAASM